MRYGENEPSMPYEYGMYNSSERVGFVSWSVLGRERVPPVAYGGVGVGVFVEYGGGAGSAKNVPGPGAGAAPKP